MIRALSLVAFFTVANFAATGCSGSGDESNGGSAGVTPTPDHDAATDGEGAVGACAGSGCLPIAIKNVCDPTHTTLIKDGYPLDDASNAVIQAGLLAGCAPAPVANSVEKGAPGTIDPTTGQPLAGVDTLLTCAGGAYVQKTVEYLDLFGVTPIHLIAASDSWQYALRTPGATVVGEMPYTSFGPTHDIILIEIVRDLTNGTPVLIAFGQEAESTRAAAWYVANEMIPKRASYDKRWYVYEWTAASDAGSSATYTLKASGS
jgi:hypothetical protein